MDTDNIHIVRILGFAESFGSSILPSLVVELYQLGDLRDFVINNKDFPERGKLLLVNLLHISDPVA